MGRRLLLLGLPLALAGCSGTPLGERLSASFPPAGAGSAPQPPPATPVAPAPTGSAAPAPGSPAAPKPPRPAERPQAQPPRPSVQPGTSPAPAAKALPPAPYRLTLRLPAADPAAPAEAVTQALRAAGVSFEVERIEQAPPAAAAPGPQAPVPATSQPAPPPR